MNIEIANRLVSFRKKNGLSQEQLAEKIGVSRQAVSKWERSEASPDTDNLILLARLYNVSLDDLLKTDDEIPTAEDSDKNVTNNSKNTGNSAENFGNFTNNYDADPSDNNNNSAGSSGKKNANIFFDSDGIRVESDKGNVNIKGVFNIDDGDDHVSIGPDGIHVSDKSDNVNITSDGVFVNGDKYSDNKDFHKEFNINGKIIFDKFDILRDFPYAIIAIIAFSCCGIFIAGGWAWSWLILLTIPLYHGLFKAIKHHDANRFPFSVLTIIIFFLCGFFSHAWNVAWLIFLTIPIYHWIASSINKVRRNRDNKVFTDATEQVDNSYNTDNTNE